MFDQKKFEFIKKKYGAGKYYCASWAMWAEAGEKPKSNIGDLDLLDPKKNKNLFSQLKPNIILVGLNFSDRKVKCPFANFHDKNPRATDYRIRYALKDTPFWGAYMTDIIKVYPEKESKNVMSYLRKNPSIERQYINIFLQELNDLGTKNQTIIAFGNDAHLVLSRNLKNKFKIKKITHYAHRISKEKYREEIKTLL